MLELCTDLGLIRNSIRKFGVSVGWALGDGRCSYDCASGVLAGIDGVVDTEPCLLDLYSCAGWRAAASETSSTSVRSINERMRVSFLMPGRGCFGGAQFRTILNQYGVAVATPLYAKAAVSRDQSVEARV
jgi:hypothetical protein